MSMLETVSSTAIGFLVSMAVTAVVPPLYGYQVNVETNFQITLIFTVLSVVRGYCVRRMFAA